MADLYGKDRKQAMSDDDVLREVSEQTKTKIQGRPGSGIVVRGIHDVAVRFSKCCSPLPGDEIVGFVTRGRGISIHRTDCVNIIHMNEFDRVRLIDAEWETKEELAGKEKYLAEISIFADNRNGLLADVSKVLTEKNVDILTML